MRKELDEIDWGVMMEGDTSLYWLRFKRLLLDLEKKYVPLRKSMYCNVM